MLNKFTGNEKKTKSNSETYLKLMFIFLLFLFFSLLILFYCINDQNTLNKLSSLGSFGSAIGAFFASAIAIYLAQRDVKEKIEILIFKKKYNEEYLFCRLQNRSQLQITLIDFAIVDQNGKEVDRLIDTSDPNRLIKMGNVLCYEDKIDSFGLTKEIRISNSKIAGKKCKILVKTTSGNKFNKDI